MRPQNIMVQHGQRSVSLDVGGPSVGGPIKASMWLCLMKSSLQKVPSVWLLQHPYNVITILLFISGSSDPHICSKQ